MTTLLILAYYFHFIISVLSKEFYLSSRLGRKRDIEMMAKDLLTREQCIITA
jgi:hypothetical protein